MHTWLEANTPFLIFAGTCLVAFGLQYAWLRKVPSARLPWPTWLLAGLLILLGWGLQHRAEQRESTRIQVLTENFARLYADEMEDHGHWELATNVTAADPLYQKLIELEKNWEQLNPAVSDIYTLRKSPDGKNIFIVDSETDYNRNGSYDEPREQRTPIGEVYDKEDPGLELAFRGQANFDFVPLTDRWGTWVSAYVPLRNPAGRVEGVLGVDFDAHEFLATLLNAKLRVLSLIGLLQLLLLGASTMNASLRARLSERQSAEVELRKREGRMRVQTAALEAASNSVVITAPDGTIQWVNPAFTQLTGYAAEEVIGQNPRLLKSGSHPKSFYQELWQTIIQGQVWKGEITNCRKDGRVYHEEMTITPVRDAGGTIIHFIAIKQDITERKKAEASRAETSALLVALLGNTKDHIYFKDLASRFVHFSAEMQKNFQVTRPEEMKGRTDFDFFSEEHARPAFEAEQEIIRTGNPILNFEEKATHSDGRVAWVLTSKMPWHDESGRIIGTMGISRDITGRKQVEVELANAHKDLKASEQRLRAMIETHPECVKLVAADGTLLEMNPAGLRLVEADQPDQILGGCVYDLLAPEHLAKFQSLNEAVFRGESGMAEFEIIGLKGTRRWMQTHACPIRDVEGRIFAQLAVTHDITGRKRAEAELVTMHKQLMEASRLGGMAEIATNVLHNVGNVLNSVNVSASVVANGVKKSKAASLVKVVDLLREHEPDLGTFFTSDPRGRQMPGYLSQLTEHFLNEQKANLRELGLLQGNIDHIKEIVAMQQNYAKVSGLKEVINLNDLVEDCLRMNDGAMSRHQVEVVREFGVLPLMTVEKHKILQVLVNLVRNAKHACQDSLLSGRKLTVRTRHKEDWITIEVMDNGVGIPPENLTRIFNHGFTTRKDGHGFGLHSGALAAKEMGGSLLAHSEGVGKGATFTLELPVEAESTAQVITK